jgi:hypothetical protein
MDPDNPDPFGGSPDNWSRAGEWVGCPLCGALHPNDPRPPTDPAELDRLNRWMDEREEMQAAELAAERK